MTPLTARGEPDAQNTPIRLTNSSNLVNLGPDLLRWRRYALTFIASSAAVRGPEACLDKFPAGCQNGLWSVP